ncbi:MAG: hypothetical protein AB7O59_24970 [Pirellulales bacterium]
MRVAWGGGEERVWSGSIRISKGSFSELQSLGIEANQPGAIWLDAAGITIREPSVRAYDGVDVLVTAELDAQLTITLADEKAGITKTVEFPLNDLVHQSHNSSLDSAENRLLVTRAPGDRVRIVCHRDHLVFAPGEMFKFELAAHLVEGMAEGYRYNATIYNNANGQRVWSTEYEAGAEGTTTTATIRLPEAEGVYDLSVAVVPTRLRARIYPKKSLAERKLQFVVLDPRSPADPSQGLLARVVEIDPVHPRWWERLGNIPLIPGLRKGPLGNGQSNPWNHPTLGPMIQLGPGGAAPDISWEAYPLPISKPGVAHVLEIEYPSDVPQAMGISLIEPNAAGAVMPIGLDSGVYVSDEEAANPPQMSRHRVIFWPRTKTPLVLISNRRQGARAVYGKISVSSAAHSQFPTLPLPKPAESGPTLAPAFADPAAGGRLWAGYLDRPLFSENFSAPEAVDPTSRRSLDDWNTMYQGGVHLVRYLKYVGYGGLMMSAYADGSTIYPSATLAPTPRYDTGVFFGSAQDPLRKDALELLFRLFDREGLVLIPGLQFAAPLPELEALRRAGGAAADGIEWLGADGKTFTAQQSPKQGLAPYYNLLDPRVQEAMLKVTREVVERYAAHPSFGGLALQLSADGYAQLPGAEWGFDDATIAQFEAAAKTKVPGAGDARFAERAKHLTGPGRTAWVNWRAEVVAAFHRRVEREIATLRPGAKLYLAGGAMLEGRQTQLRLRPTLPKRAQLDDALVELGIAAQAYRDEEHIVFLRPQHLRPAAGPLPAQAADLEINLAPEMDKLFTGGKHAASLFYHEPQKARLTSFDLQSPWGAANTYTWLVSQMSPSGDRNRRRFAHALATLDAQAMFDGGWLLPLGQEAALTENLRTYRLLPDAEFETVAGECQPVTIRRLDRDGQTYAYLVNDSPWPVTVTMFVDAPPQTTLEKLGTGAGVGALTPAAGGTTWKVALGPYDLAGARFSAGQVQLRAPQVLISEPVRRNLHQRIQDLGARVAALNDPQPMPALENWDFEALPEEDKIAGWTASADRDASVALDRAQSHGGNQSIKLASSGQSAGIISAPFAPPTTGRIAVDLWLRPGPGGLPRVRIALEGQLADGSFDPYGVIPAVAGGSNENGGWIHYHFPIDDVPSEGLANVRVRLDVLSTGEVWIDDVQLFDLPFTSSERFELSKLISLASVKLEAGQFADCLRLLEGYWPQFLVANVPLAHTTAPVAERTTPNTTAPSAEKKPTMLESLKGRLPKLPLR